MKMAAELNLETYIAEPDRGRRRWEDQPEARRGTYANRRRLRSKRGHKWMRRRGELIERSFAHCLETGGMRRVHLRGRENILKRYCVHVAGFNLSLVMRQLIGFGTPRGLQGRFVDIYALLRLWITCLARFVGIGAEDGDLRSTAHSDLIDLRTRHESAAFSTGC